MGCSPHASDQTSTVVRTGAQVLSDSDFDALRSKRVGLITNQTARVDSVHLIDAMLSSHVVELAALFGPEHGIRGDVEDGAAIKDGTDPFTGIPVFSLYGSSRAPELAILDKLDVLVFDIQDIGARFYTFISTMGHSMQAAARAGIPFVVLDRPNPLGGRQVDGFVLDSLHRSFIGLYPIPIQHGMSVGELAAMIKGEGFLENLEDLDLEIIRMEGWRREMTWPDIGRPWVPTSPNIPDFETALVYPGMCFFEGTAASEGRGTNRPFRTIGAPWLDAPGAAEGLGKMELPGVRFAATDVRPRSIPGVAASPKFEGEIIHAITIDVTDRPSFSPLRTGIAVLSSVYRYSPETERASFFKPRWLGLLSGTDRMYEALLRGDTPGDITLSWAGEVAEFESRRKKYLLYD